MADIKNSVVQKGEHIVLQEANTMFDNMVAALLKDKGVTIKISQGYKSEYDVVNELRSLVKDKTETPPDDVKPLLDGNMTIEEIVGTDDSYITLSEWLSDADPTLFEPPLKPPYTSIEGVQVYPYPNKLEVDPRRTGKLYVMEPKEVYNSVEVQKWLVNNAILYGFLLHDNDSLYYVGVDKIKEKIKSAPDKQIALKKLVGTFLRTDNVISLLTLNANALLAVNSTPTIQAVDWETINNHGTKDNNGKIPELVIIDKKPVFKKMADAIMILKTAAKKDGINIIIDSGFRPAYGLSYSGISNKGNAITFDTQEAIRRNRNRWVNRNSWPGNDEDFIFNAPSTYYNPMTAPPGTSNHGFGTAIDVVVGTRDKNNLKNDVYVWLVKNSWKYGFIRTVKTEEWHYDYLPEKAKLGPYAKLAGTNDNRFYTDLQLAQGQFPIVL